MKGLHKMADINSERLKSLLKDMVDIYSPTGKEQEIVSFSENYLSKYGLAVTRQEVDENRSNLIILPDGDDDVDIVVVKNYHNLYFAEGYIEVFLNDGSGGFASDDVITLGRTSTTPIAADLDDDEDTDLAALISTTGLDRSVQEALRALEGQQIAVVSMRTLPPSEGDTSGFYQRVFKPIIIASHLRQPFRPKSVRILPVRGIPGRSVASHGCRRPRCTRISPPAPPCAS